MTTSIKQPRVQGLHVIETIALSPSGTLDLEVNESFRVVDIQVRKVGTGGASDSLIVQRLRSGSVGRLCLMTGTFVSATPDAIFRPLGITGSYQDLIAGDSIRTISSGTDGTDAGAMVFVTVTKK